MHVRVVRFSDVGSERAEELKARLAESDGPPEGVTATSFEFLYDADQQTAVVIQRFDSAENMASSEAALAGMDPSETPGTRQSVDRCEQIAQMDA